MIQKGLFTRFRQFGAEPHPVIPSPYCLIPGFPHLNCTDSLKGDL
jgi:hypothetical protein